MNDISLQPAVIQTMNLSKGYKENQLALDNLNLSVQKGEIFGYLGPNGAGKTTTIRILMDLIRATSGSAKIFGMDVQKHAVELHQKIGFMPGELNLWPHRTGKQIVNYFANMRGQIDQAYVNQLVDRLQLDLSIKVRDYSTGNRRKLGLILALMHKPELLILDEPTSGLDPLMQQTFNEMMREWRQAGRTVFLSSHVLSEIQAICDRVGILRHGQLKAVERVETLMKADFQWVTLHFRDQPDISRIQNINGVSHVTAENQSIKLRLQGDFDPLLRALNEHYIVDINTQQPSLEEIFLAFYGSNGSTTQQKERES